jgi:methylthioribose-1-phosphate isomerase
MTFSYLLTPPQTSPHLLTPPHTSSTPQHMFPLYQPHCFSTNSLKNLLMTAIFPVIWRDDRVFLIDQTKLPNDYEVLEIDRVEDMAKAIINMVVRGAPAIGVAAAYGMYLGAREIETENRTEFYDRLEKVAVFLSQTRPTAVNLFWAISRVMKAAEEDNGTVKNIKETILKTALDIQKEDLATCQQIGDNGLSVMPETGRKLNILTHCNTGSLATAGYGTALGVIRSAWRADKLAMVYADETRPRLQGAKLTAWECVREGIPVTLITDSMAAHCMKQNLIDAVIVGADRIAANGDTANKIGTYSLAVVAKAHNVPFFVAAPQSTIDFALVNGSQIPIEERDPVEIYRVGTTDICPTGIEFYNPAFDVTPADLIAAIITEKGAFKPADLVR